MQKNENRPGYKKTKVGWIPNDWVCLPISRVTAYVDYRGKTPPKSASGIFLVTAKNVQAGFIDYDLSQEFIPEDEYPNAMSRGRPAIGDVLITTEAPLGNVAMIDRTDIALAQRVIKYRANKNTLDNYFLKHSMLGPVFQLALKREATGGTVKGIKGSRLHKLPIPLPSLPEQEAIAEVLECWDKAIRGYERKIEKKRNIKKGLMQRLLSGKQRLPGFDGEWKEVRLGEIVDLIKEKVGDRVVTPMSLSAGIGFVSQAEKFGRDISGEQYRHYTLLPRGCFTYNKGNSKKYPQGCVYLLEDYEEVAVPNVFISFKLHESKADNEFFRQMFLANMHGRELVRYINSGVRNDGLLNLNTANFLKIKLSLPPLPEQQAVASVLSSADAEISALDGKLAALREQKRFLLNNMVTGTIRLPQFADTDAVNVTTGDAE